MKQKKKRQRQEWIGMGFFVLIGAACGVFVSRLAEQRTVSLVAMCLGMYIGLFLHMLIHEAGHLVFGLISGYGFSSFRIGSLMWLEENGRIRLKKLTLAGTGGQCLMAPPEMQDGRIPVVLYNLGGCIMNLAVSAALFVIYLLLPGKSAMALFLLALVMIGVAVAMMNGIPLRLGAVDNDGYNALSLGKNPDAMRAFWHQLKVNEQMAKGVRLKDMPEEWFAVPADETMGNSVVAAQGVFAANRLMDQKRFEEADRLMTHLLMLDSGIVGLHRDLMICDRMYCELIGDNRKEILDSMRTREQIRFMKTMKKFPQVIRTEYAYALLAVKDGAKAGTARDLFEKVARSHPYASDLESERELMDIADAILR